MTKKIGTPLIVSGLILLTLFVRGLGFIETNAIDSSYAFSQLTSLAGITWALYVLTLLGASIIFKGRNNKAALILWTIGFLIETSIWELMTSKYLLSVAQPYIMNWALPICMIPLVLLVRYRIRFTTFICVKLLSTKRFSEWANDVLSTLEITRIELVLRWWIVLVFTVDFFQSVYLSIYAILNDVPWNGSISMTMIESGHFNAFELFYIIQLVANIAVIAALAKYSYMDRIRPDDCDINLSMASKERLIRTMHVINHGIINRKKENTNLVP